MSTTVANLEDNQEVFRIFITLLTFFFHLTHLRVCVCVCVCVCVYVLCFR